MVRFFMNMTICICCIIGSAIPQNLCMGVTPMRKMAMSQAPSLARYPRRIERPPKNASSPEAGTTIEARGTPCDAAKPIVCFEKWLNPDIRKITANNRRPRKAITPDPDCVAASETERFERVEAVAIVILSTIDSGLVFGRREDPLSALRWMSARGYGYNK